jgi:hypothetical protein
VQDRGLRKAADDAKTAGRGAQNCGVSLGRRGALGGRFGLRARAACATRPSLDESRMGDNRGRTKRTPGARTDMPKMREGREIEPGLAPKQHAGKPALPREGRGFRSQLRLVLVSVSLGPRLRPLGRSARSTPPSGARSPRETRLLRGSRLPNCARRGR